MKYPTLRFDRASQRPVFAGFDLVGSRPGVVAGEVDVRPSQRREEPQQVRVGGIALFGHGGDGTVEIDRAPKHDGRCEEVQPAGRVTLLFERSVADFSDIDELAVEGRIFV